MSAIGITPSFRDRDNWMPLGQLSDVALSAFIPSDSYPVDAIRLARRRPKPFSWLRWGPRFSCRSSPVPVASRSLSAAYLAFNAAAGRLAVRSVGNSARHRGSGVAEAGALARCPGVRCATDRPRRNERTFVCRDVLGGIAEVVLSPDHPPGNPAPPPVRGNRIPPTARVTAAGDCAVRGRHVSSYS